MSSAVVSNQSIIQATVETRISTDYTAKIEKISQEITRKIEKAEAVKKVAIKVTHIALTALAVGIGLTALFYLSPAVPFLLTILIPIVGLFAILISIGTGSGNPAANLSHTSRHAGQELWQGFFKISVHAGINLGQMIYTAKVAIIAGLANAAVAALTLPIAAGGGIAYLIKHKEIKQLEDIQTHLRKYQQDNQIDIPEEIKNKLRKISPEFDLR